MNVHDMTLEQLDRVHAWASLMGSRVVADEVAAEVARRHAWAAAVPKAIERWDDAMQISKKRRIARNTEIVRAAVAAAREKAS